MPFIEVEDGRPRPSLQRQINASPAQKFPRQSTRNRDRMSRQCGDLSQKALRFVENAELPQHGATVVVDFFPSQTVFGVEGVHAAQRELDATPRRRKPAPPAEVRTANHDFEENRILRNMAALYFDLQVRQGLHQLLVKLADSVAALVVLVPGLIIVPCGIAEGAENTFKVMLVFQSHVLLNHCDASRPSVLRNRCACHIPPSVAFMKPGRGPSDRYYHWQRSFQS